jgi:hypothetical protein
MTRKRKQQSAAELMAELSLDPAFAMNKQRREDEEHRRLAGLKEEEKPLVAELKAAGVVVETVWDFVNTSASYRAAIPILARHLSMPYSLRIKEGIARALTVPYGGSAALSAVIDEFDRQNANSEVSLKWVLGNTISVLATPADADRLISLVMNPANGKARDMIILALPRLVEDKARLKDILRELKKDEDVRAFAKRAETAARRSPRH